MTDQSHEIPQDDDLRILVRIVSACTLGLWAFAAGLLIGVFLFRDGAPFSCRRAPCAWSCGRRPVQSW